MQANDDPRGLERPELVRRAPQLVALRKLPLKVVFVEASSFVRPCNIAEPYN